ncbi:MAG: DUF5114 domain-containing protein [Tannerellaceae bacterium]|nr:DUF5114 domain-containing protein [Tannerellaceae bacterium]
MKTSKIFHICSALIFLLLVTGSCERDGEMIYLSSPASEELIASESKIVLTQEIATEIVLSLSWTKTALTISNSDMGVPNVLTTYIEAATSEDFSGTVLSSQETNLSKAYTAAELNTLAINLGIQPETAGTVYFRLSSAAGTNMDPVYSNTVTVEITPYLIDMSVGFILNGSKEDTGFTLASPESNGIYTGFMGATGWYNFFLLEGDGTLWGNYPADGNEFRISSADDCWNLWFPEPGGCYYVVVDTKDENWSALYLPTLQISGDLNAEMNFDRPNVRWTYVFNATTASTLNIRLNTTGKQYNVATSTDDDAAIDTPVNFSQDGNNITLSNQAGEISLNVPEAGEYTLIVDLNDPNNWTCKVSSGAEETQEVPEYLYLPGIDDLISGAWTFDNKLALYNEDEQQYAGVADIDSEWGYTIHVEIDNWDDKYTFAGGDAYAGTLAYKGDDNLPAPAPGVYLIEVSTKGLTYELTELGNEIYVVGLHDIWTFDIPLAATSEPGVYSGTITIESASPWGFAIYLFAEDWDRKYGGADGQLYYQGNNITDDATLVPGTYTMTVDLLNNTYTIN